MNATQAPKLSVVLPIKNEMSYGYLKLILGVLKPIKNIELIWVSGPSSDGTVEFLKDHKQNVIETNINSRGGRLNVGIRKAQSEFVLLHHPRSLLTSEGITGLINKFEELPLIWGGFTHKFKNFNHWLLKFTSWYSNQSRFDRRGIIYLDHCIFFNKKMVAGDCQPVAEVDIFEDTLFSKKLFKIQRPIRLPYISLTSPVRFETNGVFKQSYLNQKLKWQLYFGKSLAKMNKKYEEGLSLNSDYK